MTLEQSLTALKSAFTGKASEVEAINASLSAANAKANALSSEVATLTEKLAAASAAASERDALAAKVEALAASLASVEAAKVKAEASIESVGKKAATIVAAAGATPVEIAPAVEAASKSTEDLWNEYCSMKPSKEKTAFYNKHRSAFIAAKVFAGASK